MKSKIWFIIIIILQILTLILIKLPDKSLAEKKQIDEISTNNLQTTNTETSDKNAQIKVAEPVDILSLPNKIDSWNLLKEDWEWFFTDKNIKYPLVYNKHDASFVRLSPSHQKLGFFFYPEDHSLGEIVLAVLDIDQKVVTEVYHGDTWTSNWEWKDNEAVIIRRSCGTECMTATVINIVTKTIVDKYQVY